MSVTVLLKCKYHPKYTAQQKPRPTKTGDPCWVCQQIYDAVNTTRTFGCPDMVTVRRVA